MRKRLRAVIAAPAVAAGAGVGGYAALADGDQETTSTTAPQTSPAVAQTVATGNLSVGGIYELAASGVVEITTTSTAGSSTSPSPFGGGGGQSSQAQGSGFVYDAPRSALPTKR
jgi:hypothetical protein